MSTERIKVLHVLHALNAGGMEGRVGRLARGLDRARFEVSIVTLRKSEWRQVDLPEHVPKLIHVIPPGLHLWRMLSLARLIRRGRYQVVHTHNWSSMFYGVMAARLGGARRVFHGEHGLDEQDAIPWKRLLAQRGLAFMSHRLVAVNASIARHLRQSWLVGEKKVTVMPNGVDLRRFRPAPPPEEFTVATVARHSEVKNIPCLIDGFARLLAKIAPAKARLVLVGEGPLTPQLKDQCARLGIAGQVDFAGDTNRPEDWYARFSAYVNCSVYEGMSNTVLEAMACGLPVVVSDVQGHRDWIREEENALFFPSGDAASLGDRLERLFRDEPLRRAMGARNRRRVEAEFDNDDFLKRYAGLYYDALGVPRPER